jgi:hypothetical protein
MATTFLGSAQTEQQHFADTSAGTPARQRWNIPPPTLTHWMRLFLWAAWTDARRYLLRYRFWGTVWLATHIPFFDSLLWLNQPEQDEEQEHGETAPESVVDLWGQFLHRPDVDHNTALPQGLETAAMSRLQEQTELAVAAQNDNEWVADVLRQLPSERRENNVESGLRYFCRAMQELQLRAVIGAVQSCASFLSVAMSGDRRLPNDPEARRIVAEYNRRTAHQCLTLQELVKAALAEASAQRAELRRALVNALLSDANIAVVLQDVLGDTPPSQRTQQEIDELFLQLAEEMGMIKFMLEQLFPPLSQEELRQFSEAAEQGSAEQ